MRSVAVVVINELRQHRAQVALVDRDHEVFTARADIAVSPPDRGCAGDTLEVRGVVAMAASWDSAVNVVRIVQASRQARFWRHLVSR